MIGDLWDVVVGIPLDDWRRATTTTELGWLTHLREHPMPQPPKPVHVAVPSFSGEFVRMIPGRVRS